MNGCEGKRDGVVDGIVENLIKGGGDGDRRRIVFHLKNAQEGFYAVSRNRIAYEDKGSIGLVQMKKEVGDVAEVRITGHEVGDNMSHRFWNMNIEGSVLEIGKSRALFFHLIIRKSTW